MCVFLFDVCKYLLLRKTDVLNLFEKQISRKENLKKCTRFEEQKSTKYIRENVFLELLYSAVFLRK